MDPVEMPRSWREAAAWIGEGEGGSILFPGALPRLRGLTDHPAPSRPWSTWEGADDHRYKCYQRPFSRNTKREAGPGKRGAGAETSEYWPHQQRFFLQRGKHGGIKEKERDRSRERSHEGIGEFSFLLWTDRQMAKESERYCYRVG